MDGFRDIYERYFPDVRRFALFLRGDAARADDLAADTFVRAWQALAAPLAPIEPADPLVGRGFMPRRCTRRAGLHALPGEGR